MYRSSPSKWEIQLGKVNLSIDLNFPFVGTDRAVPVVHAQALPTDFASRSLKAFMATVNSSPFARLANIDYPAEVGDLIADRYPEDALSFAAAAGYAVVASTRVDRALLFSIAAGSTADATQIALPSQSNDPIPYGQKPRPLALSMWLAEKTAASTAKAVGIAVLSHSAVLRIYPRVSVDDIVPSENFQCLEIRVDNALSVSVGDNDPCSALHVSSLEPIHSNLIVFGSRGSAAVISLRDDDISVLPLSREQVSSHHERSSLRFGSIFYSAIRSIGAGIGGRDNDWQMGSGPYEIVDSHLIQDELILIRCGGDVERWGRNGMIWFFNAFCSTSSSASQSSVISSAITSDGTLVLLTKCDDGQGLYRFLRCYDVRSRKTPPSTCHISIPVDNAPIPMNSSFAIVTCCDIVCLFNPELGRLAWRSVARGVPSEGQVQGSLDITPVGDLFYLADVSRGLCSTSTSGVAACLHQNGILLSCFEVPAPISGDVLDETSEQATMSESVSVLWRSFLQYNAGQIGAARASLQVLVNTFVTKGFDTSEALSQIVISLSRDIVCKDHRTFDEDGVTLLVDTGLERKMRFHRIFLKMLSDVQLFTQVRPDAPSIAEDRIWDALDLSCRYSVMTDNEMLAAAIGIRQVENAESTRKLNGGFNEAAFHTSMRGGKVVEIARALRTSLVNGNKLAREGLNVVNAALLRVGREVFSEETVEIASIELYRKSFEFPKFVPALNKCMSESFQQLGIEHNVPQKENVDSRSVYLQEARGVASLSCEAAIAMLEASMDARTESSMYLSRGPVGLKGVRNWLLESSNCISSFLSIAKQSMEIGLKSSDREKESIMGLATLVVDKLLSNARQGENFPALNSHRKEKSNRARSKRRRVEPKANDKEWIRLVRVCMNLLRDHFLDDEAFRLAEKYGDFETMMALKVEADDFNSFMESEIARFGEEFAYFAFHWLEDRGKIGFLLRGHANLRDSGEERGSNYDREPLKSLLSEYFSIDRKSSSNLSWMHWLASGDLRKAVKDVTIQMEHCAKPGKLGSVGNTRFLSSVGKLAYLSLDHQDKSDEDDSRNYELASARLELVRRQTQVLEDKESLVNGAEVVRGLVDRCPAESEELCQRVLMAIEAIRMCAIIGDEGQNEKGYVWRRCVERQADLWVSLRSILSCHNDVEMREKLRETALFMAACQSGLSGGELENMLKHGMLEDSEFDSRGCTKEVCDLVRTTVGLASA